MVTLIADSTATTAIPVTIPSGYTFSDFKAFIVYAHAPSDTRNVGFLYAPNNDGYYENGYPNPTNVTTYVIYVMNISNGAADIQVSPAGGYSGYTNVTVYGLT